MEFSGIIGTLEKWRKKNADQNVITWKPNQAPGGGVFWVGVKNRGSDTSNTAAVFLLAIVYK